MLDSTHLRTYASSDRLNGHNDYIALCLELVKAKTAGYASISEIQENLDRINEYPNINRLKVPKGIHVYDESSLTPSDRSKATRCIIEGELFAEHMAAGEATRLGLGTKYLINVAGDLDPAGIAAIMSGENGNPVSENDVLIAAGCMPRDLLSISLGVRHMLQYSFDIYNLSMEFGADPCEVLSRQKMLIVINEGSAGKIIQNFQDRHFFGFSQKNVLFMIQEAYHGIAIENDRYRYATESSRRLHNHGQIVLQQTMDHQIFRVNRKDERSYLSADDFEDLLSSMEDKIVYNIEDFGFLTGSIDLGVLALALEKGKQGFRMLMEIVANDPDYPQKGGMAAFDSNLEKNVMIESFQLRGIENSAIKFLNKNFNHYPQPLESFQSVREQGLNMPLAVKDNHLYFQPVQGDINFLVRTEFFQRKHLKPILAWKSAGNIPLAIREMKRQDEQPGFSGYIRSLQC